MPAACKKFQQSQIGKLSLAFDRKSVLLSIFGRKTSASSNFDTVFFLTSFFNNFDNIVSMISASCRLAKGESFEQFFLDS